MKQNREPMICATCGYVGPPTPRRKRGSTFVEKLLWYTLFFPGIFYSFWRRGGEHGLCMKCGGHDLLPFDLRRANSF